MNTYTVSFLPDTGIKNAIFVAERIEYPARPDDDAGHIKFWLDGELVGSVDPESIFMIGVRKNPIDT